MAVDLGKMQTEAPHLVDLCKQATGLMLSKGLDPRTFKSAVVGTFDYSGSTESGRNRLYSGPEREMQGVGDIALAAGFAFDDDGKVPLSLFHNSVIDLGEITPSTSLNCLDAYRNHRPGGTNYIAALRWIVEQAGFGHIDLGDLRAWAQALKSGSDRKLGKLEPLTVKATAPYPTYAIFATDGEPMDDIWELIAYLYLMSQLPIFVSCIGVGYNRPFRTLERLNKLPSQPEDQYGRLIDNVGAFDSAKAGGNQQTMLKLMLDEYSKYYPQARKIGLVKTA